MHGAGPLLWLIALVPTVLGALLLESADFASAGAVLNALGRLTGIAALAFTLVAAVLSCRVPGFDRPFGGLTKLWRTHHRLGGAAFLLVLVHPVLLALGAAEISLDAAARTLIPDRLDWGALTGWGALLVMTAFLAPTFKFFGPPEYQRWRNVHRLAAAAVVLAVAHMGVLARTIAEPLNAVLWVLLAGAAVAAVAYRLLFSRRIGKRPYVVSYVARPANNVVELSLEAHAASLSYEPGQFLYLTPYDRELSAGYGEEHPYSLSSSPLERRLRIAIKDLGDATHAIQRIRVGSTVRIEGPYGAFFSPNDSCNAELWIAGGIGISPFLSRARHIAMLAHGACSSAVDVQLFYCVQDETRAYFADELEAIAARVDGFSITMHYFYLHGPLSGQFLTQHCRGVAARAAYVCGPAPLMALTKRLLAEAGVPRKCIRSEEFTLL